ncbi:restriction endonuclease subunit S [Marinobacter nauticus]|uniref:restriction endonuclease subunit S n=1 Tax=Marinobacter nauticus TaxID=2743 RepID=UPI000EAE1BFC|nr:restriction endonuclease subunit S [Marinobacter nauticus]RKR71366.1 type I restriction enzyme S subunit [Marinobacter nauticus]
MSNTVPDDWSVGTLTDFSDINPRLAQRSEMNTDTPVSFIKMEDVSNNAVVRNIRTASYGQVSKGFTSFQNGDVLVAKITPCFENGKGGFVQGLRNGVGFGSTEFHVLRARKNSSAKFLYQFTNSEDFRLKGAVNMTGSAGQRRVPTEYLKTLDVAFPPLFEQQKIAAILFSVDDVIEKTRAQIDKLKDLKTGMMQELLTKGIGHTEFKDSPVGRIPKQWTVVRIGDLTVEHKQGYYSKEKYSERGTYVVRITDMSNPKISFADMPRMEISDADKEAYKISKGDFLFARSGAIGRYGIYESGDEAVFASYIIRFRFSTELCTNRFIGYCYESDICQDQLSSITQGSSNININAQNIKDILVPRPSVQEQKEIATRIESIDNNIEVLNSRYQKFKCIKAALMQDLLTGKVRVKIDQKESAVA